MTIHLMSSLQENGEVYKVCRLHDRQSINQKIIEAFKSMSEDQYLRQTHFFNGRYENIYVDERSFEPLQSLISEIRQKVSEFLHVDVGRIKFGFWINAMLPGQKTTRHSHDDLDELLSGVYYLQVPENSGCLRLFADDVIDIQPAESMLVFFSPALQHEVLENRSRELRLSIGFNAGVQE